MRPGAQSQQAVRHAHAATPNDSETALRRDGDRLVRVGPWLEPQDLRADRDGLARDVRGLPRWTEDVDDIDGHVHIRE